MNFKGIRRLSLLVFIGFLILTALIAMVTVLTGTWGETQAKILASTLTISAASICSMSCIAFVEKRKRKPLGLIGIFLSITAAILLITGMWPEINSDGYWKTTLTFGVFAVALAHAFLLSLPDLDDRQKWIQPVTAVTIGILAFQIVIAFWGEINNDWYYRFLILIAILLGLETLVIPILMKLRKGDGYKKNKLILEKIEEGIFRDHTGKTYRLTEIDPAKESL